jgi:outer membrane protein
MQGVLVRTKARMQVHLKLPIKAAGLVALLTAHLAAVGAERLQPALPLALSPPAQPQPACEPSEPGAGLNLQRAIALALCNSAELQQAEVAIERQWAGLGQARAAYWPTVSLALTRNRAFSGTTFGSDTFHSSERSVGQNFNIKFRLIDLGGRSNATDAAYKQWASAVASREATLLQVATRAAQTYTDAVAFDAAYQADLQAQDSAQELVVLTQARQVRGLASGADTLQAQMAHARATLATSRSKASRDAAMQLLRYLTAQAQSDALVLSPVQEDRAQSRALLADFAQLQSEMVQLHPALQSARLQLQSAQHQVRAAASEGLPSVDWSATRTTNRRTGSDVGSQRSTETVVGLTLNVPLFEGFSWVYRVRGVESAALGKAAELADTQARMAAESLRLRDALESALQGLDASLRWVELSQANLGSARLRYQRGLADISDLVNAHTEINRAQKEYIQAQSDWSKAFVGLQGQLGLLDWSGATRPEVGALRALQ